MRRPWAEEPVKDGPDHAVDALRATLPGMTGAWNFDTVSGLAKIANEITRQAAMIGYLNAFQLMAFMALAATPLAIFMTRVRREP